MKQRIFALLLAAGMCLGIIGAFVPAAVAADGGDGDLAEAVEVLSTLGIVSGYEDGDFHASDPLTRAQFCKMAVLAGGYGDQVNASAYRTLFSDVPGSGWAAPYVNLAYAEGLVSGYGDGSFGPGDPVTAGQAVTAALRLLGYADEEIGPFWPEDYMEKAASLGLLEGVNQSGSDPMTRGDAALLLYRLLGQSTADGQEYLTRLCAAAVKNAVLLDNNAQAEDGATGTAQVYANGALTYYRQAASLSGGLVGRKGTLLLDKAGKTVGFLPDDTVYRQVVPAQTAADGVTDASGGTYAVSSSAVVLLDGEKKTYGECWYDLEGREQVTLYYAANGGVELVAASRATAYSGVALTGYYEAASPNTASPTRITLLGMTLDVADGAAASLSKFEVGERLTVLLNGAGEVASACETSQRRADLYGILESAASGRITLTNGLTVQGEFSSVSAQEGDLVKVASVGMGKLSVSTASTSRNTRALNVAARTLGSIPLADNVKLYERVGDSPAVEIGLDDLLVSTVAAAQIDFSATDADGKVCLLLLDDVTGNAYTYGFLASGVKTEKGISDNDTVTNKTVSVTSAAGTTEAFITGTGVKTGDVGGVAGNAKGRATGIAVLTKAKNVARASFDGSGAVVVDGVRIPVADNVQVYNSDAEAWTTLTAAKSFAQRFTVYYSGTAGEDAVVRVVCTE